MRLPWFFLWLLKLRSNLIIFFLYIITKARDFQLEFFCPPTCNYKSNSFGLMSYSSFYVRKEMKTRNQFYKIVQMWIFSYLLNYNMQMRLKIIGISSSLIWYRSEDFRLQYSIKGIGGNFADFCRTFFWSFSTLLFPNLSMYENRNNGYLGQCQANTF